MKWRMEYSISFIRCGKKQCVGWDLGRAHDSIPVSLPIQRLSLCLCLFTSAGATISWHSTGIVDGSSYRKSFSVNALIRLSVSPCVPHPLVANINYWMKWTVLIHKQLSDESMNKKSTLSTAQKSRLKSSTWSICKIWSDMFTPFFFNFQLTSNSCYSPSREADDRSR